MGLNQKMGWSSVLEKGKAKGKAYVTARKVELSRGHRSGRENTLWVAGRMDHPGNQEHP